MTAKEFLGRLISKFREEEEEILTPEVKEVIIACLKSTVYTFGETYTPQLIASFIYDSVIDLCVVEPLSYFAAFIIGATFLSSYELEKAQLLIIYIFISIFIVLICKICEKIVKYRITAMSYTIVNFLFVVYVNTVSDMDLYGFEDPKNQQFLALAFMNFLAYTIDLADTRSGFSLLRYFSFHFLGYMFNPLNVLNGPWITLEVYSKYYMYKKSILYNYQQSWRTLRIWNALKYSIISCCFYTLGTCILPTIGKDSIYIKCLAYRCMHYAHYGMYSVSAIIAGQHFYFGLAQCMFSYPMSVEFPISLTTALRAYDRSLTIFIQKYYTRQFDYMRAIYARTDLVTIPLIYLLVTNFHNWSLTIAFLTLYMFVYIQTNCQIAVANVTNSCVQIYPCSSCAHRFKSGHPITLLLKLIFLLLNVILITYINIVIIEKEHEAQWKELNYIGHHISMGYFVLSIILLDIHPEILQVDMRYSSKFERSLPAAGYKFMVDMATETSDSSIDAENKKVHTVDSAEIYKHKLCQQRKKK